MNDNQQPAPPPTQSDSSQTPKKKLGCFAWAGIILGIGFAGISFFVCLVIMLIGVDALDHKSSNSAEESIAKQMPTEIPSTVQQTITKAEWKQKLQENFRGRVYPNGFGPLPAKLFLEKMGKPDSTQTVGNSTYWYYECQDGKIQLVLNSAALSAYGGLVVGHINDY